MSVAIEFRNVTKRYPGLAAPAVADLSFVVPAGHAVALVGPSGCGKTTSMKMINRLIEPSAGEIRLGGTEIHQIPVLELRRSLGYVIQHVGLFPHMTVAGNIATVPRLKGWSRARIAARVEELLDLVGLPPAEYRDRYPRQLSGGQQQRVGVARALAADPPVMLMDEPFGALDPITRARLQDELIDIQRKLHKTIVFVTHDIDEAIKLGDRIAVMRAGEMVQFGTPEALLRRPADPYVVELFGRQRALKHLKVVAVKDCFRPAGSGGSPAASSVSVDSSLEDALIAMLECGAREIVVNDPAGRSQGSLSIEDLLSAGAVGAAGIGAGAASEGSTSQ
jgi:osmoprotectant transport system ATP-binding protein